jgi:hypothetical protein
MTILYKPEIYTGGHYEPEIPTAGHYEITAIQKLKSLYSFLKDVQVKLFGDFEILFFSKLCNKSFTIY